MWRRTALPPWLFSLLVLVSLAAARFYAVFGPVSVRILFPLHCFAMWALPFIFLTMRGRQQICLRRPAHLLSSLSVSAAIGAACGSVVFVLGMVLYAHSSDNWCVSIRDSFQLDQLRAVLPPAAVFAVLTLPAVILTPIGEEILFRGFLHQAFALRWSALIATLVNGLTFGLIHLHVHGLWRDSVGFHLRFVSGSLMVLSLAAASAGFTFCRLRFNSLYTAMVAHAACNLAIMSAIFFRFSG
jgi:membrane protease YdiL (CAAX protease family)